MSAPAKQRSLRGMLGPVVRGSTRSKPKQAVGLLVWLAISFVASGIGAVASIRAAPFYGQLVQPGWAPPSSVFGPGWTILYALMVVAAWLVWRADSLRLTRATLPLFLLQLAVNALWTWLFFAWSHGALAFADIVLLRGSSTSPQAIATDFTGILEAAGTKISGLKPGDTVVGTLSMKGSRVATASH